MLAPAAFAADVTPERLLNPDKEPQNWLMNHRTYDGQRFSPLARINRDNVKNLKLAYAVPLGGNAGKEFIEATPLAEDGFLYITDSWGVLYKIDAHFGRRRPHRLADGPQAGEAPGRTAAPRCGAISSSRRQQPARIIATNKETGKVVWETNVPTGCREVQITARRCRSRTRSSSAPPAATAASATGSRRSMRATGKLVWRKFTIPAPGEPGSETWKDKNNAWRTGGGAVWVTGSYDPDTHQTLWGTGNPVPMMDAPIGPATTCSPTA